MIWLFVPTTVETFVTFTQFVVLRFVLCCSTTRDSLVGHVKISAPGCNCEKASGGIGTKFATSARFTMLVNR